MHTIPLCLWSISDSSYFVDNRSFRCHAAILYVLYCSQLCLRGSRPTNLNRSRRHSLVKSMIYFYFGRGMPFQMMMIVIWGLWQLWCIRSFSPYHWLNDQRFMASHNLPVRLWLRLPARWLPSIRNAPFSLSLSLSLTFHPSFALPTFVVQSQSALQHCISMLMMMNVNICHCICLGLVAAMARRFPSLSHHHQIVPHCRRIIIIIFCFYCCWEYMGTNNQCPKRCLQSSAFAPVTFMHRFILSAFARPIPN